MGDNPTPEFKHGGEVVGGGFSCDENDCYNVATEAMYFQNEKRITWTCKDGHVSVIEGFEL